MEFYGAGGRKEGWMMGLDPEKECTMFGCEGRFWV